MNEDNDEQNVKAYVSKNPDETYGEPMPDPPTEEEEKQETGGGEDGEVSCKDNGVSTVSGAYTDARGKFRRGNPGRPPRPPGSRTKQQGGQDDAPLDMFAELTGYLKTFGPEKFCKELLKRSPTVYAQALTALAKLRPEGKVAGGDIELIVPGYLPLPVDAGPDAEAMQRRIADLELALADAMRATPVKAEPKVVPVPVDAPAVNLADHEASVDGYADEDNGSEGGGGACASLVVSSGGDMGWHRI